MFKYLHHQLAKAFEQDAAKTVHIPVAEMDVLAPPLDRLVRHGAHAVLAAIEILNWPIAAGLDVGHRFLARREQPAERSKSDGGK